MAISAVDAVKAIAAIEKQLSALRAFAGMPSVTAVAAEKPKVKRALTETIAKMNQERTAVFEELKAAWSSANPEYASLDEKAYKEAVKKGEVAPKPRFSDALQEHSKRARADDPEKQAKYEAYRAKTDAEQAQKKSNASVSSASSAPKPEPVADAKKPRKPQSEETKAAAALKRAATKAAKLTASVAVAAAAPNPFEDAPLPTATNAEVVSASADDEEAFAEFEHAGVKYWKNGLQHMYKRNSDKSFGNWAGRFDQLKKSVDSSFPEPAVE